MYLPNFKKISIDGVEMKELYIGNTLIWKSGHTNLIPLSTEADGITIYNGGLGYKDGYRVRSGGAEAVNSDTTCTGYIPFTKNDILYIYPSFAGYNIKNAINFYNIQGGCIGQINDNGTAYYMCAEDTDSFKPKVVNGVSVLDLSNSTNSRIDEIMFVRVTNLIGKESEIESGSQMIITVNEEIEL